MKFYKGEFMSMTANGIEKREGYRFDYLLGDGTMTQLGVYKTDGNSWRVVDLECGLSLCIEPTRKAAVEMAEKLRDRYMEVRGSERYKQDVENFKAATEPPEECPEVIEKAATVVSLETLLGQMREWCKEHPNTAAFRSDGEGATVRIAGIKRKDKELHKELTALGFRWSRGQHVWMYDTWKAEKEGMTVIDGR